MEKPSFKQFLRKFEESRITIREDKLVTKEDDGGGGAAAGGGDGGGLAAPGGEAPAGDIVSPSTSSVSTEILGKCDHKHDGFFGPGCFHRPFPIFTGIVTRYGTQNKKKKKKYIKVLDLTESDEYDKFKSLAKTAIYKAFSEANQYLKNTVPGTHAEYEEDYDFSGAKRNWVAALDKQNQDDANTFLIAINLPAIYAFLADNGLEDDEQELLCQMRASVYHEIGHTLVQYCADQEAFDFEFDAEEEEEAVEEFANWQLRQFTGATKSSLNERLREIFGENGGKKGSLEDKGK